ncbi:MAG: exonuclease [Azospirillum sp.]|nr:exonuclease [Azospirillum sp.]
MIEARVRDAALPYSTLMAFAIAAAFTGLWIVVNRTLLIGAAALAGEARVVAHGAAGARVAEDRFAALAPLPEGINQLLDKLAAARQDIDRAVAASTARTEEQNIRLAAILRDLHEGVLVCNLKHQILLYNQTALNLLRVTGDLGLGRNLFHIVLAEPVLHTLERLTLRLRDNRHHEHVDGSTAQFVGGTTDGRILLQGRMSLIHHGGDENPPSVTGPSVTGYVVTFTDATRELAALGQRDALLREAAEGLRPPVANLRAMLETMFDYPELTAENRANFEQVTIAECNTLSQRLERISTDYRGIISGTWPMSDIHSSNLITLVIHRVAARADITLTPTGLPQWLHGDSFSLVVLLDFLIERVREATGLTSFDLSAEAAGRWVHIDIAWTGAPTIASAAIDGWKSQPLADALGGLTVGDVMQHHRSDLWSEAAREGYVRLRLPLPPALQPPGPVQRPLPARPEFFDFSLLAQPMPTSELRSMALTELTYVVFDTETTGLSPSEGDEIISIAGVRIVNGRILTGETFSALVNPGRPIRPETIPIHGITDEVVRDRPSIAVVLPKFKAFVAGAVLVAHNAAFDLKFLKMKAPLTGIRFDNPVLDTMLLSLQLQGENGDHTLDGIAARLGIEIVDRHSALGDSLVTAAVFLRMIDMLKERGIRTLDDAIRGANIVVELHARERAF